jgi:hypothetical protein
VAVYITEAHASDEWPVGPSISFCRQPQSVEERCGLAQNFVNTRLYRVPMLVDTMENDFQKAFAAWPFRYFIVKENRIAFKAQPSVISLCYNAQELSTLIPQFLED